MKNKICDGGKSLSMCLGKMEKIAAIWEKLQTEAFIFYLETVTWG